MSVSPVAQPAFGSVRVDLIDDSGTPMPTDVTSTFDSTWSTQWNLPATAPSGCSGCATNLAAMFGFYEQQFGTHRGARLPYL